MASITRLIRASRPSVSVGAPWPSSSSVSSTRLGKVRCMMSKINDDVGFNSENARERKPAVVAKAAAAAVGVITPPITAQGVDLANPILAVILRLAVVRRLSTVVSWKLIIQSFIDKVIIDCRFFTMLAVVGTLIGSVLCFLEGAFLVVESYLQYFQTVSNHSDHGRLMHLLIEALDMFLVGTAMLAFGMGLHVMFMGSQSLKSKGSQIPSSNFFGLFYLKEVPSWVGMKSVTQGKSKIGHALLLLLQVGVLDKFKSVPMVTGLDLACFAGALFVSAAALFVLSRISYGIATTTTTVTEKI